MGNIITNIIILGKYIWKYKCEFLNTFASCTLPGYPMDISINLKKIII